MVSCFHINPHIYVHVESFDKPRTMVFKSIETELQSSAVLNFAIISFKVPSDPQLSQNHRSSIYHTFSIILDRIKMSGPVFIRSFNI